MDAEVFPSDHSLEELEEQTRVVPQRDHFPLCVVWCPLPIFSWFFPIIGHVGITTSDGTIFDFQGDYTVHVCLPLSLFPEFPVPLSQVRRMVHLHRPTRTSQSSAQ